MLNAESEIIEYIKNDNINGSLLLTGDWGCGKTYLIKKICDKTEKNYFFIRCSLFGVDCLESIEKELKHKWLLNGKDNKITKALEKGKKSAADLTEDTKFKGVGKILTSINILDFVEISPMKKNRKTVLIFDDFERSLLDTTLLLGYINDYCDNNGIKTIIVSNEKYFDHLDEEKRKRYFDYKEKVVYRTVKMDNNSIDAVNSVASSLSYHNKSYKTFIINNTPLIYRIYRDSFTNNLRTLKSIIIDFERIFLICKKIDKINISQILDIFIFFSIFKYEFTKNINIDDISFSEEINKYTNSNHVYLKSLVLLLKEGIYDEKEIKLEIEAVFIKKGKTIEQKLLYTDFWDLENDTIETGFPRVLDKAYKGELNRDNYVRLIRLIMFLLYYGAISPKEYDANKIVLGWENRVNKLIEKGIEDDPLHIAIFDKAELLKIDKTLYELYKEIELHEIELMSTKGKKFLIYNIKNPNKVEKYDSRAILIDKLDQEIIDLFIDRYSSLGNYDRIIITRDICDISIDTHDNSEIIIDSICKSYQSLIDGLNSIKKDNDIMGCCTIKESITMLSKKISEYSKLISDRKEQ